MRRAAAGERAGDGLGQRLLLPLVLRNCNAAPPPPNRPPDAPAEPSPPDGAVDQAVDVNLAWTGGDPDGDALTYDVYLDAGDTVLATLVCDDLTSPACDPGTLSFSTLYSWQVVARDEHGATTSGPVWHFATAAQPNRPPDPPSSPAPPDGAVDQAVDVGLAWTGSDPDGDGLTYDVYLDAGDTVPATLVCDDLTSPACDPGTLSFSTLYSWQVVARDEHGATTSGPVWRFATAAQPNRPPDPPSNPSPPDGAVDVGDYLRLTWVGGDPDGHALTYDVYLDAGDSPTATLVCDDATSGRCDAGPLACGASYSWQVVATDARGATTAGPIWQFSTLASYVPGGGAAPRYVGNPENGKFIMSFADSYASAYTIAYPALRTRGLLAMAYVVIEPIVGAFPGKLSGCQCDRLNAAGWDVASHGYSHDDPTQMTPDELTHHLADSQAWLLGRGYTLGPRHYGPPANRCNQQVLDAALIYYDTVWDGYYSELPAGFSYSVMPCGNNVDWDTQIRPALDLLIGYSTRVLRCSFHDMVLDNPSGNQADLARLNTILDYVQANGINVVILSDLLDGR